MSAVWVAVAGGSGAVVGAGITQIVGWRQARRTEALAERYRREDREVAQTEKANEAFRRLLPPLLEVERGYSAIKRAMFEVREFDARDDTLDTLCSIAREMPEVFAKQVDRLRSASHELGGLEAVEVVDALLAGSFLYERMLTAWIAYVRYDSSDYGMVGRVTAAPMWPL